MSSEPARDESAPDASSPAASENPRNPYSARFPAPEFRVENPPNLDSAIEIAVLESQARDAQRQPPRDETKPPRLSPGSWLGAFGLTILCLVAGNIAFGIGCTVTVMASIGNGPGVVEVGLTISAAIALAVFVAGLCLYVVPYCRRMSRPGRTPPRAHNS